MHLSTRLHKAFAQNFWNLLPGIMQKGISEFLAKVYSTSASRLFIGSFAQRYKMGPEELSKYSPGSGADRYLSFQDFFTRKLVSPIITKEKSIFPVEGQVCESGQIYQLHEVNVKGHNHAVREIFGDCGKDIPDTHFFINIFLHNHNYHRFHAPVNGTIKSLQYIPGQLNFLRPWLYPIEKVSEPAFVNERVVLEIEDDDKQLWFVTFVGGMSVGKIKMSDFIRVGARMNCGEEIGFFLLGSTCCIAAPVAPKKLKYLSKVKVGEPI